MQLDSTATETRPEAMGDVPGICELPLTRAVVQYRDLHEMDAAGGRIEDIGLALVVEGKFASTAEVVDLGSGSVKVLDLSTELVVLDWVYDPTIEHVAQLITASAATRQSEELQSYTRQAGTACPRADRVRATLAPHLSTGRVSRHLSRPGSARGHIHPVCARSGPPDARSPRLRCLRARLQDRVR